MKKEILVCIDRDGTLIYDDRYFLGRTLFWKKKVKILPKVVEGIKELRKVSNVHIYLITNQTGVAIKDFPLLTDSRAKKVTKYVMKTLNGLGVELDGFVNCPHTNEDYVRGHPGRRFISKFICDCPCIKPNIGMIDIALKELKLKRKDVSLYVIGDRMTDVHTAHNAKGCGIIVPFKQEKDEIRKVKKFSHKNTYVAKDFLDACSYILKKSN